jgi:hypothetical protein
MIKTIRNYYRAAVFLVIASLIVGMLSEPKTDLASTPSFYIFMLAFMTSCWCNILLVRGGYVGKSSLVILLLVSILGLPPVGFLVMLFVLGRSIKNIELTGKT